MGGETGSSSRSGSHYPQLAARPVGQQIHGIYLDRLGQFTSGGQYRNQGLVSMYDIDRETSSTYVKLEVYSVPDLQRPSFAVATKQKFRDASRGEYFGPSWSTHWFRIHLTVPTKYQKYDMIHFHWDADSEGLIWSEDGVPLQGLTGGGERSEYPLPKEWNDGKPHLFYVEMACNGMFGVPQGGDTIQPPDPNRFFYLREADIVVPNVEAKALYYDFWMIGDAAREFPSDSWESHEALQVATKIVEQFIPGDQNTITNGRKIAQKYLGKNVDSTKVYDSKNEIVVYATGHCHIDTCWLWPWAETKRKVARSWASQIALMETYPEHRFSCSQAQQYKWLKALYPPLFDKVKEKVKSGQFQPIGGSWVEHDTNMPSGESLVRQFLYGQRFFESNFGSRCETFWLPDTFGYSPQIPQLCRLAGMSRFMTQKLSWNNINKFPHTTFNWVALDGSQVLCHMPPCETYTSDAHFGDVKRSMTQHKSLDQDKTGLLVFGKGDGGGGPTAEMLEKLRRLRGISDTVGLLPRVHMGNTVDDFFRRLEKKAAEGTDFVTWYGELYFELHRGTYTTQAETKRHVRKGEFLLHDIEYTATVASVSNKAYRYPKKDIDDLWEALLLCQFHDCLPGSSIEMVYDDAAILFEAFFKDGQKLLEKALKAINLSSTKEAEDDVPVLVNTHGWARRGIVEVDSEMLEYNSPGFGIGTLAIQSTSSSATAKEVKTGVFILENSKLKATIIGGHITSLIEADSGREVMREGEKGNQYVIFDDKPLYWQAWDVEVFHLDTRKELSEGEVSILSAGPDKASILVETRISKDSWIKTTISLTAAVEGLPSVVTFECELEWRETMKFLKVEFPIDVVNTEATYETQFGLIKRPTHYNTSWDMAKFEVCNHKWADLSESGFGMSVLNDCKYGFATVGNVMRLSLMRAPKAPDAHADMGRHYFKYAILPHAGPLDSRTIRAGYDFNNPMRVAYVPKDSVSIAAAALGTFSLQNKNNGFGQTHGLVLDTIKRGEDDEDHVREGFTKRKGRSIVLRIFDSLGGKSSGVLGCGLPVSKIYKCNALEDDLESLKFKIDKESGLTLVDITLRAFEVATFRVQLA